MIHQFECRGWDTRRNIMLPAINLWQFGEDGEFGDYWAGKSAVREDIIILLYSGIKDKNHVKVYQMDIVDHGGVLKAVIWHMGGLVVIDENAMLDNAEGWYVAERLENIGHDIKVVGNVYQHKHLLRRYR